MNHESSSDPREWRPDVLRYEEVIDKIFPLSEAAAAHAYIEGRSAFGRVVMTPR